MYAFYVVRGITLDDLANKSFIEKIFLHHAQNEFYKKEEEKYKAIFGGNRGE